jgi:hypothetical protein
MALWRGGAQGFGGLAQEFASGDYTSAKSAGLATVTSLGLGFGFSKAMSGGPTAMQGAIRSKTEAMGVATGISIDKGANFSGATIDCW